MPLTLPNTLQPGTYEDANALMTNFTAVKNYLNGSLDGSTPTTTAAAQLALDSSTIERRAMNAPLTAGGSTTVGTHSVLARASAITMPSAGVLWVAAAAFMDCTVETLLGNGTYTYMIRLNGVTVKSRFGTAPASGVSGGLLQVTDVHAPLDGSRYLVYTDDSDAGLSIMYSADGSTGEPTSRILSAFIPISVDSGVYTVDLVQRVDTFSPGVWDQSGDIITAPRIYVKSEAF